jgi:addiction module RelE/StbE family toxin
MKLVWSSKFIREFKRLKRQNPQLIPQVEQTLQSLTDDPFHPSLRTHKLQGDLSGIWACSIDYNNRILFEFVNNSDADTVEILLHTLGSHDTVY